jgi:hypothetical protein
VTQRSADDCVRRVLIPLAADASGPLLWLLVTSVFMLLRPCHLPQSGRHRTLPLVQG